MLASINIQLDRELAQRYDTSSPEDRRKIQVLLSLLLQEVTAPDSASLGDMMDSISENAQARGLTPELLETLLDDDE